MPSMSSARAVPHPLEAHAAPRPGRWEGRERPRPAVAMLLMTASGPAADASTLARSFAVALPEFDVVAQAGAAGDGGADLRRLFAGTRADVYVLAHRDDDPLALARAVAAIESDGLDLVAVTRLDDAPGEAGDRLLGRALHYLFGADPRLLVCATRICSRRFALSYGGDGSPLDLTLHALRRRMAVGEVLSVAMAGAPPQGMRSDRRGIREWLALGGLVARLFAEERPRRTFGLIGIGAIAAGLGLALYLLRMDGFGTGPAAGPASALCLGLLALGAGAGAAGLLLDGLVQARQDVSRISHMAMRRAGEDLQSSVS